MNKHQAVVVLGASSNPNRTSYLAAKLLMQKGRPVFAYGNKKGKIGQLAISDSIPNNYNQEVDTISIFLKPEQQIDYYNYILQSNPKKLIFNPGSENPELEALVKLKKTEVVTNCTIALTVMGIL
jgi:predicted CoA-binding protein